MLSKPKRLVVCFAPLCSEQRNGTSDKLHQQKVQEEKKVDKTLHRD